MSLDVRTKKYVRHRQNQSTLSGGKREVKARPLPDKYLTPLKAHNLHSCFNCLRIDPYSLCGHKCIYCYSLDKGATLYPHLYDGYNPDKIREGDMQQVKDKFNEAFNRNTKGNTTINMLRQRAPIHMSDLTDAFQPCEEELYRKRGTSPTLEALDILKQYSYPVVISTKSALPMKEPWKSAILDLVPGGLLVQSSITTMNEEVGKKLEPGAAPSILRLKMLKDLKDAGLKRCTVRISPVIPKITSSPDVLNKIVDCSIPANVDVFLLASLFVSGNKDITQGFINNFGIDLLKYYKSVPHIYIYGCQYHLQYPVIKQFMFPLRDYIHKQYDMPVNFDMPPGMYPLSDMYHCCGGDGIFKPEQFNSLGMRGISRFILDYKEPITYEVFHSLVERKIVSKEHDTIIKDLWKNMLYQMVGLQYLGKDSTDMPIFQGMEDPFEDPKLTKGWGETMGRDKL